MFPYINRFQLKFVKRPLTQLNQYGLFEKAILGQKSSPVSGNRPGDTHLTMTRPHSQMCIRVYTLLFQTKNPTQTKSKREWKNKRNQRRKGERNLFLLVTYMWKIQRDTMIWFENFICVLLTYVISLQRERMLKNKLWKTFVYISSFFVQDENQELLMQ